MSYSQRVIAEGRKNVHAFVRGTVVNRDWNPAFGSSMFGYNPYMNSTFVDSFTGFPVESSGWAWLWRDADNTMSFYK